MDPVKDYIIKESSNRKKFFSPFWIMVFLILFVIVLGYIDYITGVYLSFHIFYLAPVALGIWLVGRWAGIVLMVASAIAWFYEDIAASSHYPYLLIPYWNLAVKLGFFLIFIYIISKLKQSLQRERLFARIDYLTEVSNRKNFFDLANKEVSRSSRNKYPFTLIYIDLDDFKRINDSFGHNAGDELLRLVAKTLQESVRLSDTVARIGGDEFVVLFPETGSEAAAIVIQRVRDSLLNVLEDNGWSITFSIGAATCAIPSCAFDVVMAMADNLMYAAKKAGKNMVKHEVLREAEKTSLNHSP